MTPKMRRLQKILRDLQSVVIAYSGGLDSTFLMKVAVDTLGRDQVLAVTARSETYPAPEYAEALAIVRRLGARHLTIKTKELSLKKFRDNPVNRCYYCKRELFGALDLIRRKRGMAWVLDGTNYDDLKDIRYGRNAAAELNVRSPLVEARMGKPDIRAVSRRLRLPTWGKPSSACLASRFPFHTPITAQGLRRVGRAEAFLRSQGFGQLRVRAHGSIARIEVLPADFPLLVKRRTVIIDSLKKRGFSYVTMDLAGYRTGSMHEAE